MGWTLREVPFPFQDDQHYEVGICYRIPIDYVYLDGSMWGRAHHDRLSPEFRASGRDYVIVVVLPPCWPWVVDEKASTGDSGWTVTGELPNITVTPSINAEGVYHGWIQNGVVTDDCEGRTYP
jgi:hypothetical protein